MGSRAIPTCTVEAGAAMGSESWLWSRPTSHPRQWIVCGKYSLTWPLATGHFPTV